MRKLAGFLFLRVQVEKEQERGRLTWVKKTAVFALQILHVLGHDIVLIARPREVVAETTARCVEPMDLPIRAETVSWPRSRGFGFETLCRSNGGDIWTRRRERWDKLEGVFSIIGDARSSIITCNVTDAAVTGAKENGDPTSTELCEAIADALGIIGGDGLLIISIGGANDLW